MNPVAAIDRAQRTSRQSIMRLRDAHAGLAEMACRRLLNIGRIPHPQWVNFRSAPTSTGTMYLAAQ